jgi:hypothetical protein
MPMVRHNAATFPPHYLMDLGRNKSEGQAFLRVQVRKPPSVAVGRPRHNGG